jgi:hypothetical protein
MSDPSSSLPDNHNVKSDGSQLKIRRSFVGRLDKMRQIQTGALFCPEDGRDLVDEGL